MKLTLPLPADPTTSLTLDLSKAEHRQFITVLHWHLQQHQKYAGLNPDVKVDARTDRLLNRFLKRR